MAVASFEAGASASPPLAEVVVAVSTYLVVASRLPKKVVAAASSCLMVEGAAS